MSKPKHYMRGRGRWIGYGINLRDYPAVKGAMDYKSYLINEIEEIKHRGGKHVAKLRRYLARVS